MQLSTPSSELRYGKDYAARSTLLSGSADVHEHVRDPLHHPFPLVSLMVDAVRQRYSANVKQKCSEGNLMMVHNQNHVTPDKEPNQAFPNQEIKCGIPGKTL